MKLLITTYLALSLLLCFGQDTHSVQMAKGIARYRSFLLEDNPQKRWQLGSALKKLAQLNLTGEKLEEVSFQLGLLSLPDSIVNVYWKQYLVERLHRVRLLDSLTDAQFTALVDNSDLYDLTSMGVLELDYPFIPKKECSLYDELEFYQISNGDRVGEIGAGSGEFSVVVAMIYDSLSMQINDIDSFSFDYITFKMGRLRPLLGDDQIKVICSDTKDTHFTPSSLDKIIIRNSYHHFKHEKEMLRSISVALADDGVLFLQEIPIGLVKGVDCSRAMKEEKIISEVEEGGFELMDRKMAGDYLLLKFVKSQGTHR